MSGDGKQLTRRARIRSTCLIAFHLNCSFDIACNKTVQSKGLLCIIVIVRIKWLSIKQLDTLTAECMSPIKHFQ